MAISLFGILPRSWYRPPSDLEHFARGIKVVSRDCCISEEGGAVPYDPRLTGNPAPV